MSWQSKEQGKSAWQALFLPIPHELSWLFARRERELRANTALFLLGTGHIGEEVDEPISHGSYTGTPLHRVLTVNGLSAQRVEKEAPRIKASLGDEGYLSLPAFERLALALIEAGADPWKKDSDGRDALDLAARAGARTLFASLVAHPGAPAKDELIKRSDNLVGRQVPFTHLAAYQGRGQWLDDLAELGWPADLLDNQKWPALAWVNDEKTFRHAAGMMDHLDADTRRVVENAWAKRHSGGLVPEEDRQKFTELLPLLADTIQMSAEEEAALALSTHLTQWLATKPSEARDKEHIKGKFVDVKDVGWAKAWFSDNFERRFVQKAGLAKGTWSPLGAALWAHWMGSKDAAQWLLQGMEPVLCEREDVSAFLDEDIRHGISNRALLGFCAGAIGSNEGLLTLLGLGRADEGKGATEKTFFSMIEATCSLTHKASTAMKDKLGSTWSRWARNHHGTLLYRVAMDQLAMGFAQLMTNSQATFSSWNSGDLYKLATDVANRALRSPEASDEAMRNALVIAERMLGCDGKRAYGMMWEPLKEALAMRPALVGVLSEASPTPEIAQEWQAVIDQARLTAAIPEEGPARRRPRM